MSDSPNELREDTQRQPHTIRLLGASFVSASALSVTNVLPLLLGVIVPRYNAGPVQIGFINSYLTGASLLAAASAPLWIHRVSWRWTCSLAGTGITLIFALSPAASDLRTIYALFLFAGLFSGMMSGPSNASLGFSSSPSRWYGIGTLWQNVVSAAFYFIVPAWIEPRFGYTGVLTSTAVILVPCIVAGWLIRPPPPRVSSSGGSRPLEAAAASSPTIEKRLVLGAAFAAALLVSSGGVSYWVFLERLAKTSGISDTFIGLSLAVANVAAVAGSLVAATVKRRSGTSLALGLVVGIAGFTLMLAHYSATFMASVCLYAFAWSLAMPALQAIIRQVDFTNRLFVASPSTVYIAGVFTGPLVGQLVIPYGYVAAVWYSTFIWLSALLFGLYAYQQSNSTPGTAVEPSVPRG